MVGVLISRASDEEISPENFEEFCVITSFSDIPVEQSVKRKIEEETQEVCFRRKSLRNA